MKLRLGIEVFLKGMATSVLRRRLARRLDHFPRHQLPTPLIVSLTSYRPRFHSLHLALLSLLDQTIRPDRVVLWIAHDEMGALPRQVRELTAFGLEIRTTDDIKSYKKLIPALHAFPAAHIATADDDVLYPRNWLELLCLGQQGDPGVITCHRAHRIPQPVHGAMPPYRTWEWDILDPEGSQPSRNLVATGVGGILYPPDAFHPDVIKSEIFTKLCPQADDMWFYWMARRAGTLYRKIGPRFRLLHLPGSVDDGLFTLDVNDAQVDNLFREFGDPLNV
jgi:hypothetical protein